MEFSLPNQYFRNYLIDFTLLRYDFWIFFIYCDNTIFFATINWIVNANKFIYNFLQNPIYFFSSLPIIFRHFNINLDRRQFIVSSYTSSPIAGWDFLLISLSLSFPSLTFSSSLGNLQNALDWKSAITTILENNICTASSELTTYRRSYVFLASKSIEDFDSGITRQINIWRKRNCVSKRKETLYSKI